RQTTKAAGQAPGVGVRERRGGAGREGASCRAAHGRETRAARPHDHGLFVVAALFGQVLDLVLADLDRVVVLQQLLLDRLAIDVGAVGAVEVFDEDVTAHQLHDRVLPTDRQVVDDDVVVGAATQGGLVLGDLDFLDDHAVERDDQFSHAKPLAYLWI